MIEFWYEFASTYSYPSAMRIEKLATLHGVSVTWRPFLLGPIFADLSWQTSPFNLQPAKGAYMWRDLQRSCASLGLPFSKPREFPQNGLLAARIAMVLEDNTMRADFSRAVFDLQFAKEGNISDAEQLEKILLRLGHNSLKTLEKANHTKTKDAFRKQTERAQEYGIFGAPTWRTSDGEIFWGNDRLESALSWANSILSAKS